MDWSLSPLVALFFAVQNSYDEDAAIYVLDNNKIWIYGQNIIESLDPFNLDEPKVFMSNHVSPRMKAQIYLAAQQAALIMNYKSYRHLELYNDRFNISLCVKRVSKFDPEMVLHSYLRL